MQEEEPDQAGEPSPGPLGAEGSPDLLAVEGSPDLLADQSLDDMDVPPELPAAFTPGMSVPVDWCSNGSLSTHGRATSHQACDDWLGLHASPKPRPQKCCSGGVKGYYKADMRSGGDCSVCVKRHLKVMICALIALLLLAGQMPQPRAGPMLALRTATWRARRALHLPARPLKQSSQVGSSPVRPCMLQISCTLNC